MKFLKTLIQAVIFILLLLIIVQNQEVFTHEFQLALNIILWESGTFATSNIVLIAAAFLIGVILSIVWGVFRNAALKSTIKQQKKQIRELENRSPEPVSSYSGSETLSFKNDEGSSSSAETSSHDPFKSSN